MSESFPCNGLTYVTPVYLCPKDDTLVIAGVLLNPSRDTQQIRDFLTVNPAIKFLQFDKSHPASSSLDVTVEDYPGNDIMSEFADMDIHVSSFVYVQESEYNLYADNFPSVRTSEYQETVKDLVAVCSQYKVYLMDNIKKHLFRDKLTALITLSQKLDGAEESEQKAEQCFLDFKKAFESDPDFKILSDESQFPVKKLQRQAKNVFSLGIFSGEREAKIGGGQYWQSRRELFVMEVKGLIGDVHFETRVMRKSKGLS